MNGGRLRVCLISEELPPETGWGGIGSYCFDLARGLSALGHRVHVVARGWGEPRVTPMGGALVHRVPMPEPSWRRGTWWINKRFPESRQVFLWSALVRRAVAEIRAREGLDVIESPEFHAQGLLSSLGAKGAPMIVRLHTPAFMCRQRNGAGPGGSRWDTWLSEAAERWTVLRAAWITSPSRALAAEVAGRWRIGPDSVRVVPNPIDESEFLPRSGSNAKEPVVLFVGRLERRKGVETLIAAWPKVHAAVPQARASFVGADHPSAPGGESMRAYVIERLGALAVRSQSVSFTDAVVRSELPAVYAASRVSVVPSLYENFPYTCLEAMACGCAVVASRVGGIPEMITDGEDGLLVGPGSEAALADAIIRLLEDEPLRRRLGLRARRTVCERFSRRAALDQTVAAYRAALAGRGHRTKPHTHAGRAARSSCLRVLTMRKRTPIVSDPELPTRNADDLFPPPDLLQHAFLRPSLEKVQGLTMVHETALVDLAHQMDVVLTDRVPGAFVECGVWCGGASFFMADLLRRTGVTDRKVWLFDSFEGMPKPQPIDGEAAMQWAKTPQKPWYSPRVPFSLESVQKTAAQLGLRDHTVFVKGWFDETLPRDRERLGPIAILRIDCDWYASVKCCLENLYDQVSAGGFVVLDDYYTYDGCTLAVHEFLARRGLAHRIETTSGDWQGGEVYHAARFRKGPTHWKLEHREARLHLDLAAHVPPDHRFVFVDEEALRGGLQCARWAIPFPEQNGEYAGLPPDGQAAIGELERLRAGGAAFAVVAWPALWWLDHFPELNLHLLFNYRCVLRNERAVIFDLRNPPSHT